MTEAQKKTCARLVADGWTFRGGDAAGLPEYVRDGKRVSVAPGGAILESGPLDGSPYDYSPSMRPGAGHHHGPN